jgi:hypothetical protein
MTCTSPALRRAVEIVSKIKPINDDSCVQAFFCAYSTNKQRFDSSKPFAAGATAVQLLARPQIAVVS